MDAATDALACLRLMLEWGADEAMEDCPVDRTAARPARPPLPAAMDRIPAGNAGSGPAGMRPNGRPPLPLPGLARPAATGGGTPASLAQEAAGAARTLEELRATLERFDACPLRATATSLVFADGDPQARLMLVGEAPGAEEDRTGRPFVGASGRLLDKMLASVGLDRSAVLITNLIPWRPPGNRPPTDSEVLTCLPFLLRHIELVRPRRLALLGGLSAKALTGSKDGIRRQRGRWVSLAIPGLDAPVPALPMFHPAYLLRTPGAKREAWADLIRLRRALDADAAGNGAA